MNSRNNEEKRVRSYLLGELPQEEVRQLEERLLREDEFVELVLLTEDELIEDYACGDLLPGERKRFEEYFLSTTKRRLKLMTVRGLKNYVPVSADAKQPTPRPSRWGWLFAPVWLRGLFFPRWRAVAFAALILASGAGLWRAYFYSPSSERALLALREAYAGQRPLETRITGFTYAPFQETRGREAAGSDARARDRSAAYIHEEADPAGRPSPAALHNLGRLYLAQKEFDKALSAFDEALKAAPDDATLHADAGVTLFEKGKLERLGDQSGRSEATLAQSLTRLNRALELNGSLLEARFNRALLYMALGLTPQAVEDWRTYLAQDPDPDSPWGKEARKYLALIEEQSGRVSQRNQELFGEFMSAYEVGDQERMWRVFCKSHFRTGNLIAAGLADRFLDSTSKGLKDEAEHRLRALSSLGQLARERTGDSFTADLARFYASVPPAQYERLAQARSLRHAAYDSYNNSKNDEAVALYARASALFDQLGDHPEALLAQYGLSHCYSQLPDTEPGFSTFKRLEAECELKGYHWLRAISLNGLANVCTRRTQYSEAVGHSLASYDLSVSLGDENGALRSLNTLSGLYRSMGGYHKSLRLAQEGFELAERISADNSQRVGLYATSAWSLAALGLYASALEFEKEAVRRAQAMSNPLALSRYHVQLGLIHGKLKNYEEALSNVHKGLEIGRSVGEEKSGEEMRAYASLYMGRFYREAGQFAEASEALQSVFDFGVRKNDSWLLHQARKEQFQTHVAQRDVARAREELVHVLSDYEQQREKILEEGNRNTFFDKEQDVYDLAIDFAYTALGDKRQSFDYSEISRSRSLLDTSAVGWRVQTLAGPADLRFSGASKPEGLDELARRVPERAQLLQYAVLRDKLIIWYVARDRFDSRVVGVSSDELSEKVDRFLNLVSRPQGDERLLRQEAAELYGLLVGPVVDLVEADKHLCVVPDKILNFVPFAALLSPGTGRYLAEDFLLSYAQSLNVFLKDTEAARRKGEPRSEKLLSVGNPLFDREAFPLLEDLPYAAREATRVKDLYDSGSSSLLTGPDATKGAVLTAMSQSDVLHLATHYVPDSSSPMSSKLLLARVPATARRGHTDEGVLPASEIYGLRALPARLAVLSACQTGVEGYFKGEGTIGLSRPFQACGVPLVIASLWPVDSRATADLMVNFHRLRKPGGLPSVEALRGAQMQMFKGEDVAYRHPYYWASFVVIGGHTDY
jgi:CHAT domain-containing protein